MGHCYSHLTRADRYKLEDLLNAGRRKQEIADILHVHVSTIYREIKRARWVHLDGETWIEEERYNPDEADRLYRENLKAKGTMLKIGNDFEFADYIERKIRDEHRSPAAALAEAELEGKKFRTHICVNTLYSYIAKGVFLTITNADLPEKPKKKRTYRKVKTAKRPPAGESIEHRPAEVDERSTFGHWEMDTVYSAKKTSKTALLVLTERLTREEIVEKMQNRTIESTLSAMARIEQRFGADLFRRVFRTITVDNGGEFSDVERLERSATGEGKRTTVYFCHPFSSYERGSNECQNKMIRRKYPKGTDFGEVPDEEIRKLEEWINNYPRKVLGWRTAAMLFRECVAALS